MNNRKSIAITCILAFLLGGLAGMVADTRSPLYAPARQHASTPARQHASIRAYNDHWQKVQDAKMMMCYQKMPTIELVTDCMLKSDVFI